MEDFKKTSKISKKGLADNLFTRLREKSGANKGKKRYSDRLFPFQTFVSSYPGHFQIHPDGDQADHENKSDR